MSKENEKLITANDGNDFIADVSASRLNWNYGKVVSDNMSFGDCIRHYLPYATKEQCESIFWWCYNRASYEAQTSSPKYSSMLNIFQDKYLQSPSEHIELRFG